MKNELLFIIQQIMEDGFGKANLQPINQYVHDQFIEHQFGGKSGKEGLKNTIRELHSGLSDLRFYLQKGIQDEEYVWTHYKATACQTGDFMHIPPSGKEVSIDVMDIFRFENGQLVEHWGVPDRFAALMQLDVFNQKKKNL